MKKFFVLSILSIFIINAAFAVGDDLAITASITEYLEVVANAGSSITLDPAGNSAGVAAGNVQFRTNRKNWTVSISSLNDGRLRGYKDTVASTYYIPYGLRLTGSFNGGTAYNLFATDIGTWTVAQKAATVSTRTTPGAGYDSFNAFIKYDADDTTNWFADHIYTDTVTITVAAN